MYLKVESVSAVQITTTSSPSSHRSGVKIPVPSRQGGGAAAAAAAAASTADGAAACTPEEIYCYTQYNSSLYHHRSQFSASTLPVMGIHHLDAKSFVSTVDVQHGPGRPDRLEQVMSLHPQYLKIYNKTQNFIMRGDGPLPFHYRHYIAIMAAGRHQCSYSIEQQVTEFLQQGGDERWLEGLHCIPTKLRDLYEINKILAHRPWLITKDHIEKLTKGNDSWSLGELVHALVILSHYHAVSSFIFGSGIGDGDEDPPCLRSVPGSGQNSTAGSPNGHKPERNSPQTYYGLRSRASPEVASRRGTMDSGSEEVGLDALMRRMKNLAERRQEFSAEEQNKRYEHVESQSAEIGVVSSAPNIARPKPEISQFIDDPDFTYQDFARRGEINLIPTFRVQDYSWDDHAFSLISCLYTDVGNLLDDKFRLMYQLTYNFMGSKKDVDTSRFRTAIWNYIQCMFGIRHDDYDYGEVNQVLERSLKAYIKTAVCYPERVTRSDYDSILKEFQHSEKIHVNLMLLEARIQAELLYALRAIMRYMT